MFNALAEDHVEAGGVSVISQIAVTHAKDAYAMVTSSASGRFGGRAKKAVRGYGELVSTG